VDVIFNHLNETQLEERTEYSAGNSLRHPHSSTTAPIQIFNEDIFVSLLMRFIFSLDKRHNDKGIPKGKDELYAVLWIRTDFVRIRILQIMSFRFRNWIQLRSRLVSKYFWIQIRLKQFQSSYNRSIYLCKTVIFGR